MLETWVRDFRHAARGLVRAPAFTTVVVLTLALAIGATTAIFSVAKPVLFEPLPFPDSDRLVHIGSIAPGSELTAEFGVPDELYFEYHASVPALEDLGMYGTGSSTTRVEGRVEQLFLTRATPSMFTTLGARAFRGQLPTEQDDDGVVVISYWMWQDWFGGDPDVIGRSYWFARQMRTVIGIMGPEFRFPDERVAFWVPWPITAAQAAAGGGFASVVARMAPGTDRDGLTAQLAPLARRVQERLGGPAPYVQIMQLHRPVVIPIRDRLVGDVATPLRVLLGTVGIVFLMACANVANLFMVRAESRRRDIAVRRALGSGRGGLLRTQMAEPLILAAAGGAFGMLIAWAGVPLLVRAAPDAVAGGFSSAPIPGLAAAGVDLTALAFTAAISLIAACAFGLAPTFRLSRGGLTDSLRQTGRGVVGRSHLTRDALVVVQTASALILLVGSALLVRSFVQLTRVDPGFETEGIFTFQIAPDRPELNNRAAVSQFQYAFMDRLAALPGVESVGFVTELPLDEGAGSAPITTPGIQASGAEAPFVRYAGAGGAYFETMGIELVQGRLFERVEEQRGIPNVIISQTAAEVLFPGEDPLDQQLRPATGENPWYTVVGVVEDVLLDDFRRESPEPMVYLPGVSLSPAYVMKSTRADQLAADVRSIIGELIPESPMYRVFTMERLAANTMASLSFTLLMLGIAAGLAVILGAVGIYGVLSYAVTRRTQEIGVRMALGAEAGSVRRMVVGQGALVALIGVVIGVLAAVALTRFLSGMLFGVQAIDAPTFVAMSTVMLAVALAASWIPARRASAVDPVEALRTE